MELKKREEIIKRLKDWKYNLCVSCDDEDCDKCVANLLGQSLALIKELTEEIKDLEADYDRVYEQAEADIHGNMADGGTSCHWCADKTKADTVKRMQALIENESSWFVTTSNGIVTNRTYQLTEDKLCQIAKELLEGNK